MFRPLLMAVVLVLALGPRTVAAATLVRDADIEHGLTQLAAPILRAAGLSPSTVGIYVVKDSQMNAFVLDRTAIYIHSGMILRLTKASELQAVIAHEAAHIANGHLTRRYANMQAARNVMALGAALSVAAGALTNQGEAAGGVALGVASSAQRVFFGHTRAEESAADQSGMRYLAAAGIETSGAVSLMELFAGQEALPVRRQDIYARSHPLSRDRLRQVKALAVSYGKPGKPDPVADYWFDRLKGKLSAFVRNPKWTFQRYKESPYPDVRAMREAVAWHRQNRTGRALAAMDRARAARPGDPYYDELRGQILLESRNWAAAANAYGAALKRAPRNTLILAGYGRSLVALGGTQRLKQAVGYLERSTARDWRNNLALRDLGSAYAKLGNTGMAALVTAERHAMHGRTREAEILAKRAADLLPRGSAGWRRAQDVLNAVEHAE
ncbi:peptidase, M48 family protein [Pseudooceanicola batsensis HTCC2597]|uniref:Peptidase, M48 family protein n=1 Tax=Pseudooceanicola batsensis (strain ATCC BAA-863 / DSM 15984 / KCTC 12145 / HTCC2597) TaxID=252305 RepID=A3TWY5_PSEBH|nr:M48 family metalloprotease [Pseudooceanicola batsensis]EAQ03345.1 peptidase, M48 family protein [Pseudooceanicola batsensis HTCC2597]